MPLLEVWVSPMFKHCVKSNRYTVQFFAVVGNTPKGKDDAIFSVFPNLANTELCPNLVDEARLDLLLLLLRQHDVFPLWGLDLKNDFGRIAVAVVPRGNIVTDRIRRPFLAKRDEFVDECCPCRFFCRIALAACRTRTQGQCSQKQQSGYTDSFHFFTSNVTPHRIPNPPRVRNTVEAIVGALHPLGCQAVFSLLLSSEGWQPNLKRRLPLSRTIPIGRLLNCEE